MRYLVLGVALVVQAAIASPPQLDKDLALTAGHAYIESYLRWHHITPPPTLDWGQATVEHVDVKHHQYVGYVAVFVPAIGSPGGGFAFFDVGYDSPDHLIPGCWGYAANLAHEISYFKHSVAAGHMSSKCVPY
jgi:hypothetical protein